jgi:LmbE family N-acetylglucosaminyl deacetylase
LGDGRLALQHARMVAALRVLCEPGDVVFSTWAEDGHPDHEAAARASRDVAAALGLVHFEYPIWGWHWARPGDQPFGGRAVRYELDAAAVACKAQALRCFGTQTGQASPAVAAPVLPPPVLARFCRPYEVFLRP